MLIYDIIKSHIPVLSFLTPSLTVIPRNEVTRNLSLRTGSGKNILALNCALLGARFLTFVRNGKIAEIVQNWILNGGISEI